MTNQYHLHVTRKGRPNITIKGNKLVNYRETHDLWPWVMLFKHSYFSKAKADTYSNVGNRCRLVCVKFCLNLFGCYYKMFKGLTIWDTLYYYNHHHDYWFSLRLAEDTEALPKLRYIRVGLHTYSSKMSRFEMCSKMFNKLVTIILCMNFCTWIVFPASWCCSGDLRPCSCYLLSVEVAWGWGTCWPRDLFQTRRTSRRRVFISCLYSDTRSFLPSTMHVRFGRGLYTDTLHSTYSSC